MINSVILTGRICNQIELKTSTNNISVCSFGVAVDRNYKKGEERQTDFINIVAWRQQAEFVAKYFKKGNLIGIQGSIQTRKYTDKNGNNRTAFEVVADNIYFIAPQKSANVDVQPDPINDLADKLNNSGFDNLIDSSDDLTF